MEIGSKQRPDSANTARSMAVSSSSVGWTRPAGRYQLPAHADLASCIISTSCCSLKMIAVTIKVTFKPIFGPNSLETLGSIPRATMNERYSLMIMKC
ncbi:hypothetical protein DERP_002309 [Dermatophagoides pteronyssinus]|uniref:Uncharacterized protein n=1 Tax=Dermatophagoides pteronyssinus TaxID=6956 RepID=A0ABQ8JHC9_DERPT|nr:hypothetical protein DERP_002309 [Dermatophagoides pteronyssinus]